MGSTPHHADPDALASASAAGRATRRPGPLPALLLGAGVLVLWWAVTVAAVVPAVLLPNPLDVARRLWLAVTQGGVLAYAGVTLREALLGCLLAAVAALPLAWALYRWPLFSRTVLPYVAASQAVPAIAVAPLLVLWIGYGTFPVVVLCAFMVFFPITVSVLLGLRGLDTDVIDAARLDGAHGVTLLAYMELPMALPAVLAGLRTGFTLSVTGAVVGEMTMGGEGLGMVLSHQRDSVDTTGLFSTIVLLCLMATSIHWCLHELERRSRVVSAMRGRRAT
ncbi:MULTISPECIES: ABC transporter permease subunit [unclassified Actinomyces]|uniref:ABC transporter permease n=1 Tax=unclassified Actinomyces TaxID=2609248 RepID=UPI002893294F|nr:ABC transporter permease subunit [Actinomyces sp. 187325]